MSVRSILLLLLGTLYGSGAVAAGNCYQWRANAVGPWTITPTGSYVDTVGDAVQNAANACSSAGSACMPSCGNGQWADVIVVKSITPGTFPVYTAQVTVSCSSNGYSQDRAVTLVNRAHPEGCPECLPAGTSTNMVADPANAPAQGSTVCESGCLYEYTATDLDVHGGATENSIWGYHSKGQACASSISGSELPSDSPLEPGNCASGTNGVYCSTAPESNCGTFNGDQVCVQSIAPGTCVSYASGGVACVAASGGSMSSPPAPDDGTEGSPANPDGSVDMHVGASTVTANYYGSGTVSNSGSGATTTGSQGGGPEEEEEGSASGGGSCDAAPACSGDPIQCAILQQEWKARCPSALTEGELQSAVGSADMPSSSVALPSGLSESGPVASYGGSCPAAPTITVMGQTITLSWITYLCTFAGQVSAIVMVAAYLSGLRILMGWGQS